MSPPDHLRKRAKKPKSTTGCKTCKARKVKCDEGKPFCHRCIKFGAACEGYEPVELRITKTERHQPYVRILLPRAESPFMNINLPLNSHGAQLSKPVLTTAFHDAREYMYFLHFQEHTAEELAGPFDADLWNRVTLQACQNEPVLIHLATSLAAFEKSVQPNILPEEVAAHQRYALRQYGRALRGLQELISSTSFRSPRIVLIASLLIFCFENLTGSQEAGITHIRKALHLMKKQLSQMAQQYRHVENASPTADLEDGLVAAFVRMDNSLLSRPDKPPALGAPDAEPPTPASTPPPNRHRLPQITGKKERTPCKMPTVRRISILQIDYSRNISQMPTTFTNITEARNFLENLQFQNFSSMAYDFGVEVGDKPAPGNDERQKDFEGIEQQLEKWNQAFQPLFSKCFEGADYDQGKSIVAKEGRSPKQISALATLRVQARSCDLAARMIKCRAIISPADSGFNHASQEILELSKIVIADPGFRRTFVFDVGIVAGVFIVLVSAGKLELKLEALRVLKSMVPRREGAWDSASLLEIGEVLLAAVVGERLDDLGEEGKEIRGVLERTGGLSNIRWWGGKGGRLTVP